MKEEIKCAHCRREYPRNPDFTEEDMRKEYAENFPDDPEMKEEVDLVCDDCYKEMISWKNTLTPAEIQHMKENPPPYGLDYYLYWRNQND